MVYSGSIYFFGNYRPAHFQAASIKALRAAMLASIKQMNMDDWQYFAFRIDDLAKQLRKNYTSVSADYGARGGTSAKAKASMVINAHGATARRFANA